MWNERKFEKHMRDRLAAELDEAASKSMLAAYTLARTKLVDDLLAEIKGAQPDLSDHGPNHVANVLDNIHYLLSDKYKVHGLSAIDLYVLGTLVLFHDVGNLYERKGHQTKLGEIFDWARGTDPSVRREKTMVLQAAAAHTGRAADGTFDTLKQVSETDHLAGHKVRLLDLAAILRLADELAEGPQRTSAFLLEKGLHRPSSTIFHQYAAMTNIRPDRGTGRIMVTYEVPLDKKEGVEDAFLVAPLRELLDFTYGRVVKLDQERRYARFYSSGVLSPFDTTSVQFNFHYNGALLQFNLPPLVLNDKVVPGDETIQIPKHNPTYALDTLIPSLLALAKEAP